MSDGRGAPAAATAREVMLTTLGGGLDMCQPNGGREMGSPAARWGEHDEAGALVQPGVARVHRHDLRF